jgi:hypothetical protein
MFVVNTNVLNLIHNFNQAQANAVLHEWSQKLVVITSHIYNPSTAFAMTQNTANDVGVTLFPSPFVLFDFPGINYVSYQVKSFAGVVFEKVVEFVSLAILGTKMNIADEN